MPRTFEIEWQISGWTSPHLPIQRLLNHLARRTKSEGSKEKFLEDLWNFLKHYGLSPEEVVQKTPEEVSEMVQTYIDMKAAQDLSKKYVNVMADNLNSFFKNNGFKRERDLEFEKQFVPTRYRKRSEYVPTKEEVWKMADASGTSLRGIRDKAMILADFSTGFRSGTLRAVRYADIKGELDAGKQVLHLPSYAGMKQVVKGACKGNIEYYSFLFPAAVEAIKRWLKLREERIGEVRSEDPIFCSLQKTRRGEWGRIPLSRGELNYIVKAAARGAGLEKWQLVHAHCLRKAHMGVLRDKRKDGIKLDEETRDFLSGHILGGSKDHYFDAEKVEWVRNEFSQLNFQREVEGFERLREELLKKEEQIERLIESQRSLERLVVQSLLTGQMKSISRVDLERFGFEMIQNPDGTITLKK